MAIVWLPGLCCGQWSPVNTDEIELQIVSSTMPWTIVKLGEILDTERLAYCSCRFRMQMPLEFEAEHVFMSF